MKIFKATIAAIALAHLLACGGGGSTDTAEPVAAVPAANTTTATTTPITTAIAATTTAAPADTGGLSAAAAAFLSLDLSNPHNYTTTLPAYYDADTQALDNMPAGTAASNNVATLGRVLFHDRRLSVNNTIACASCHQQGIGFSDSNRFSAGFAGTQFTTAHSMRLANLRYYQPGSMFWDRRAASVEAQSTQPIQHPVEMGFDASNGGLAALITKMGASPYYPELFRHAYGDTAITEVRIQQALAQYQRAMVSVDSRWDAAYAQTWRPVLPDRGLDQPAPGFTAQEDRGRHLFVAGPAQGGLACAACHVPPSFALAANSRSNGLDANETTLFKSPSLKNVARSSAFMHDGRFSTLEQVIEHYNSGVRNGPTLDNRLRQGTQPRLLNLPEADKAALVAFLRTLNDDSLATQARFTSPFKQ